MKNFTLVLGLIFCCVFSNTKAQDSDKYQLQVAQTNSPIKLDGVIDEAFWENADEATDFFVNFPVDTAFAQGRTEVKMAYDQQFVYLAATIYNVDPSKKYIVSSLRRDFNSRQNDSFSVFFDPFKDGLNGFVFSVSAYGVQREGLISNGDNTDLSWDNRWFTKVKRSPEKWTVEMMIPFKTLRFPAGSQDWGVNFARYDQQTNEYSSWKPVPVNFQLTNLAFVGDLAFDQPLKKPGANVALIPYVSSNASKNHAEGDENTIFEANAGFDAKIAVTPSLNLDLTFNPDFSQVEVDQQVTNLQRFEIFFPERRQFFIENSDLFGSFGFRRSTPFFSRRIGIGRDTVSETTVQSPILYGARLSGKLNKDLRVGLLNMQTARDEDKGIDGQNYSVATFQHQVFSRSNIGMIFVNRQGFQAAEEEDKFTRVVGVDYNHNSEDGKWEGNVFVHRAFKPTKSSERYAHGGFIRYTDRKFNVFWVHEYIQNDYDINDIGFIRRTGIARVRTGATYRIFPKSGKVNRYSIGGRYGTFMTDEFSLLDRNVELQYNMQFTDRSELGLQYTWDWIKLTDSFDPTRTDGQELAAGSQYSFSRLRLRYESDPRKQLNAQLSTSFGEFYNGERIQASGSINYRFQPFGSISLNVDYNNIDLPEEFNDAELWLIGSRLDVSFTRNVFLSSFMQYNRQSDNFNHNVRLQWRFKPVSDLFLVYTDNYFPTNFAVKNRALIMKLTYWLPI